METLPFYGSIEARYVSNSRERETLAKEGYKPMQGSNCHVVKTVRIPAYSRQMGDYSLKYIGNEPNGFCNSSHKYTTLYYEIKRSDFDKLAIKPKLKPVCIPLRLHNYDGIVDITQKERKGTGWEERYNPTFNTTITKVFFVVD